jgi:hypothetical protein
VFIIIIETRFIVLKMNKGTFAFAIALMMSVASGKRYMGLCPQVDSNIKNKEFSVSKMMGIWYEYLVTPDLKEN